MGSCFFLLLASFMIEYLGDQEFQAELAAKPLRLKPVRLPVRALIAENRQAQGALIIQIENAVAVDWSRGYESLDKELHRIMPESEVSNRLADMLFKVWLHDGQETWLLIHIEIQAQAEEKFPNGCSSTTYIAPGNCRRPAFMIPATQGAFTDKMGAL
jgi:hypothetical protein